MAGATMAAVPVEPPPSQWHMPDPASLPEDDDFAAAGAALDPGTILAAYRSGIFPMPLPDDAGPLPANVARVGWWSPSRRAVLPLNGLRVSRSLRRSCGRYEIRVDTAFDEVIAACADPSRPHGWIDDDIVRAYRRLHDLGWVHSVEAWSTEDGTLAGGLYGVAVGALFAGESMFHRRTDASKVALVGLVDLLRQMEYEVLDVQWKTPHLASLGVVEVPRRRYLEMIAHAVAQPERDWPAGAVAISMSHGADVGQP